MKINYINGDIISLAKTGYFDLIAHVVNCFNIQSSGVALGMSKHFNTKTNYKLETTRYKGDINKLGVIEHKYVDKYNLIVVNMYVQYYYGKKPDEKFWHPLDYEALRLCLRKINFKFKGLHIGLPKIGSKRAGGNWEKILDITNEELYLMNVTIVNYKN